MIEEQDPNISISSKEELNSNNVKESEEKKENFEPELKNNKLLKERVQKLWKKVRNHLPYFSFPIYWYRYQYHKIKNNREITFKFYEKAIPKVMPALNKYLSKLLAKPLRDIWFSTTTPIITINKKLLEQYDLTPEIDQEAKFIFLVQHRAETIHVNILYN